MARSQFPRRSAWTSLPIYALTVLLVHAVISTPATRVSAAEKWPDVDPKELKLAASLVEPNADAEVLLWDIRVTDKLDANDDVGTFLDHYVRIKIFTERGRDTESRVDLPYSSGERVRSIEGRSIAPDGKITELRAAEIFDRTIVAIGGVKLKAKSFVLPVVVPGSVIEYRWREIHENSIAHYVELPFQREIPIQVVRYHIKPLDVADAGIRMRTQLFNMMRKPEQIAEAKGYTQIQVRGVPALRKEPYMPAERAAKAWILLFYEQTKRAELPTSQFWGTFAHEFGEEYQARTKATGDVKKALKTLELPAGATPEQKIDVLIKYVRASIRPPAENVTFKPNRTAGEALARGVGTDEDVNLAFVALASASGLETYLVAASDRSTAVVEPDMKQPYGYATLATAVKIGERIRYVDASNRYSPGGQLRWQQEGVPVIVVGDKSFSFGTTPALPPTFSSRRHTGSLKLLENGTLEGDLKVELTGHLAAEEREEAIDQSPEERRETFAKALEQRVPGATISQFAIENLEDTEKPYTVKVRLSVPRYSERTGSRAFLQPAVMQRGLGPMFASASRQHKVVFPYNWFEEDAITVDLPAGYTIEPGASPEPATMIAGRYDVRVLMSPDGRQVRFSRRMSVGAPGRNSFTPQEYAPIKTFFDAVKRGDGYTMALRGGAGE